MSERESSYDRYERLAEEFWRDTHMMAPGKDVSPQMGGPSFEERAAAWREWIKTRTPRALPSPPPQEEG